MLYLTSYVSSNGLRFDTFGYLDNHVPRSTMISKEPRTTGTMYS